MRDVAKWKDRISSSEKFRASKADKYGWERFIKEYKGEYNIPLVTRRSTIQVPPLNKVFAYIQTDISEMFLRNPYITVTPLTGGNVRGAALLESAVNALWKELQIKKEVELSMIDSALVGHGWNKTGINVVSEGDESDDDIQIKEQMLYSSYVSWRDVVFNQGSRRPPVDCQWMAHRIVKLKDSVVGKYPFLKKVPGVAHPQADFDSGLNKEDADYLVFWEVWDKESREKFLLCDGYEKYVSPPAPWPKYQVNFPFTMLSYFVNPDEAYPLSIIGMIEPQILEEIKIFSRMLNHTKRWNRQAFIKRGTIEKTSLDSFEDGVDGAIHEIDGDPNVKFADFGQVSSDHYALVNMLQGYQREVGGQAEFQRGGTLKTQSRSVGELELIESGTKGRISKRVDNLEEYLSEIARQLISHLKGNFSVPYIAQITQETPVKIIEAVGDHFNPITKSIEFTPSEIAGEYSITVQAGSTLPKNKQRREAVMKEVLGIAAQLKGPATPFVKKIILSLLKEYEVPELEQAFIEQEAATAAMMQKADEQSKLEKAKMVADISKKTEQADKVSLENDLLRREVFMTHSGVVPEVNGTNEM